MERKCSQADLSFTITLTDQVPEVAPYRSSSDRKRKWAMFLLLQLISPTTYWGSSGRRTTYTLVVVLVMPLGSRQRSVVRVIVMTYPPSKWTPLLLSDCFLFSPAALLSRFLLLLCFPKWGHRHSAIINFLK